VARKRCGGQQNEKFLGRAASIHLRVPKKLVHGDRGGELACTHDEEASIPVRVSGERLLWDEEQGNKYAQTSDDLASTPVCARAEHECKSRRDTRISLGMF
jgi:hypothetical protein